MKPVILILNGKEYAKAEPTVGDWYNHLEMTSKIKDKNLLIDKEAVQTAVEYVAGYVGAPVDEVNLYGTLKITMTMFNRIQKTILAVFEEAQGEWGNVEAPEK